MTIQKKIENYFSSVLPEKLLKTLQDYEDFTAHQAPSDVKSFGAYHLAAKNALSHVSMLLKMVQFAQNNDETNDWLKQAKQALTEEDNDEEESNFD